jgi:hypothetical protein
MKRHTVLATLGLVIVLSIIPMTLRAAILLESQEYEKGMFGDEIIGELTNNGTDTADFVQVTATFHNAAGNIVGTDFTYTDPSSIQPGDTVPFTLLVSEESVDDATTYSLRVSYGDESFLVAKNVPFDSGNGGNSDIDDIGGDGDGDGDGNNGGNGNNGTDGNESLG